MAGHRVGVHVHIGNKKSGGSVATSSKKSGGKKRKAPSGPKRLGKLKGGLRAYWAARGVKP